MLAAGSGFGFLTQHVGQRIGHGIKRRDRWQTQMPAFAFQFRSDITVDDGEYDQAGIIRHFGQDSVEMFFRADHRPEMLDDFDTIKLSKRRFCNVFQGFAG